MPKASPATVEDLARIAAEIVSVLCPYACACRLQIDVQDGDRVHTNVFHVPLATLPEDSLEARILEVFARHRPGEWVPAKAIAGWLEEQDAESGHFKRTLAAMAKAGKLESNRNLGYRRTE